MNNIRTNLHAKVHKWIDSIGFRLNATQTNKKSNVTTNHYFFETFNFFEKAKDNDMYGEKINVRSLLDLQTAFFENISQLK
jgi:hypothetical protein